MTQQRIPQLDGLRGVAVGLVLIAHYAYQQINATPGTFWAYTQKMLSLTWCGVDLFFVLSGYLIAGILIENKDSIRYFQTFYLRRFFRIFPLYYSLLILFLIGNHVPLFVSQFHWLFNSPLPTWPYFLFLQNCVMGWYNEWGPEALRPTWSLAVEEQFYLVIPLLVRFAPPRLIITSCGLLILAAPILRYFTSEVMAYVGTPWRGDALLIGVLIAYVRRSPNWRVATKSRMVLYVIGAALLAGTAALSAYPPQTLFLVHSWIVALCATVLLVTLKSSKDAVMIRLLQSRLLVWLGVHSYGIYLLHHPISGIVHVLLRNDRPRMYGLRDVGVTLLALGLTLMLAALSFRYFERPLIRLSQRARY